MICARDESRAARINLPFWENRINHPGRSPIRRSRLCQQYQIARYKLQVCRRIRAEGGENTERQSLRIHLSKSIFWTAINKDGVMPGRKHFYVRAPGTANRSLKGYEASGDEISAKVLIDSLKGSCKALCPSEAGPCVCVTHRRQQGGTNAVTGHVSETDNDLSIGEGFPVEIVATGVVCRAVPAGNVKSRNVRHFPGKEGLLDGLRNLKIVLDHLQLALGFCFT